MKKRINLTIDSEVYKEMQKQAIDLGISVSKLLENVAVEYLKK